MSCSKVGAGRYIDQNNKKIYTVDHFKGEIIAEEDTTVELVESVEELLSHLSKSSLKYAQTYYKEPFGTHGTFEFIQSSWICRRNRWISILASQERTFSLLISIQENGFRNGELIKDLLRGILPLRLTFLSQEMFNSIKKRT